MTKLHEREPKFGDKFKLVNGRIVRFAYLIPEELGAGQRLVTVNAFGRTECYYYPSGSCHSGAPSACDIDCYYEEPKTIKAWVNVYSSGFLCAYPSKGAADEKSSNNRIACKEIEITYTEGEGVS